MAGNFCEWRGWELLLMSGNCLNGLDLLLIAGNWLEMMCIVLNGWELVRNDVHCFE